MPVVGVFRKDYHAYETEAIEQMFNEPGGANQHLVGKWFAAVKCELTQVQA